eukprot:scaffold94_cov340-Prasinococcus_capsulatus_cf.AAC.19
MTRALCLLCAQSQHSYLPWRIYLPDPARPPPAWRPRGLLDLRPRPHTEHRTLVPLLFARLGYLGSSRGRQATPPR